MFELRLNEAWEQARKTAGEKATAEMGMGLVCLQNSEEDREGRLEDRLHHWNPCLPPLTPGLQQPSLLCQRRNPSHRSAVYGTSLRGVKTAKKLGGTQRSE